MTKTLTTAQQIQALKTQLKAMAKALRALEKAHTAERDRAPVERAQAAMTRRAIGGRMITGRCRCCGASTGAGVGCYNCGGK